jgi:6,7-dimethyl-8-ribityllumazine synthase
MQGRFEPRAIEGAEKQRHAVVVARFNSDITYAMRDGAVAELRRAGVADSSIEVIEVPGAFELGFTARVLALTGRYSAITCIGCVIRGDTDHYDFVAGQAAELIGRSGFETGIPVIFGVLTTHTHKQAEERAFRDNKGGEAASCAMEMASIVARAGSK